jgi:hypothetical protein
VSRGQADFYYNGLVTKSVTYNRGTAEELRHTVGTRVFRPIGKGLDYNWEANYQFGSLEAIRFAPGACQRKLDLHLIACAFTAAHCYGLTSTAATAIRRIRLSEPSTPCSLVSHTFPQGGTFPGT